MTEAPERIYTNKGATALITPPAIPLHPTDVEWVRADVARDDVLRVKPLSWTAKGYAATPFGKYLVVKEDWSGEEDFWFVCFAGKPYGKCGEHSSEAAAMAAAEADYKARFLAMIEQDT